jgi:plastocyanin
VRYVVSALVCAIAVLVIADAAVPLAASQRDWDLAGRTRVGGRTAADVVVWLDAPGALRRPQPRLVIEQRNVEFTPKVLAAQVGSTVELPNTDRIFHNVFSYTNGKPFDLGLYPTGATKRITLDRPAVNRLYCNIHPHMAAYIVAVDTPYFATSNKGGSFTIHDVPSGDYTYHAWRSGGDTLTGTVSVADGTALDITWP